MPNRAFRHLVLQTRWRPAGRWAASGLPRPLAPWLLDAGSLTRRLRAACAARGLVFAVRVLHEGRARLLPDEAAALGGRRCGYAWVREVQLLAGGTPWVYARTVVPFRSLRGHGRCLAGLGSRPLGEVLFADPQVVRGPLDVGRLDRCRWPGAGVAPAAGAPLWARRSAFRIGGRPLLVCEIFLPAHPAVQASQPETDPER